MLVPERLRFYLTSRVSTKTRNPSRRIALALSGFLLLQANADGRQNPSTGVRTDPLIQYGERHPSCAMWTDWQRLCSRTGPGGATLCRSDKDFPVAPSRPFCVIGERDATVAGAEAKSRDRFCKRFGRTYLPTDGEKPTGPERCLEYQPNRPFGGLTIAQMEHPACRVWGTGEPGRDICSEDPNSGLPSCKSARIRALRRTEPFVCTAWRKPEPCKTIVGGRAPAHPDAEGLYIYRKVLLANAPVWGTYCS